MGSIQPLAARSRPLVTVLIALLGVVLATGCAGGFGEPEEVPAWSARSQEAPSGCDIKDEGACLASCHEGDSSSCNRVAAMYEFGMATTQDPARASRYYRRACYGSHAQGCNNLGWLYLVGRGVPKSKGTALMLFNHVLDQYRVACRAGKIGSCLLAVKQLRETLARPREGEGELALLRHACQLGHEPSCGTE